MDQWLFSYAQLTKEHFLQADENCPGAGAAGGLGFAFQSYLGARLEPGIRIVLEETGLEREMADADFVLTGEGRMDEQTAMGNCLLYTSFAVGDFAGLESYAEIVPVGKRKAVRLELVGKLFSDLSIRPKGTRSGSEQSIVQWTG